MSELAAEGWELLRREGSDAFEPVRTYECLTDAARAIIDIEKAHKRSLPLNTTVSLGEAGEVKLTITYEGRRTSYLIRNC